MSMSPVDVAHRHLSFPTPAIVPSLDDLESHVALNPELGDAEEEEEAEPEY